MKLLMESWRQYLNETNEFTILCENHEQGLITEEQLYSRWERMVLSEADQILNEGLLDVLRGGYEKGKELFTKAVEKVTSFFKKLAFQALKMMLTVRVQLDKIAGVLKGILQKVAKFCSAHKTLCKIITTILIMLAVTAVMAWMAGEAQATIDLSGYTGEEAGEYILDDTGLNVIKGYLSTMQDTTSQERGAPEARIIAQAVEWLERAQGMEELVDLKNTSEEGARMIRDAFEHLREMALTDEWSTTQFNALAEIGERVDVASGHFTRTLNGVIVDHHEGPMRLVVQPR